MHDRSKLSSTRHLPGSLRPAVDAVLACAYRLGNGSASGVRHMPLKHRNLAILCRVSEREDIEAFRDAASGLGASVAVLACDLHADSPPQRVEDTARMLSRLYDAVTCDGLPLELVDAMSRSATIPFTTGHVAAVAQAAAWATGLGGADTPEHKTSRVLKALVLQSMY